MLVPASPLALRFFALALPALAQLMVEPLARLVDLAYLGRLSATSMGAAGAGQAAAYALTKLYTEPLLRTTTSLVAAAEPRGEGIQGGGREGEEEGGREGDSAGGLSVSAEESAARLEAISTALLLALIIGVAQALAYGLLAGPILSASCVGPSSPMRSEALGYLRVCACGAPASTLWLVCNGAFRGLGDAATPFAFALAFTALNAALDPLCIFTLRMGAAGAAAGTAAAQTIVVLPLLLRLAAKLRPAGDGDGGDGGGGDGAGGGGVGQLVPAMLRWRSMLRDLFWPRSGAAALRASVRGYLRAGSVVLLRTLGKISAYSVVAREAARLGQVAAAAHSLLFQLGTATTQLCESVAIATQALLAREIGSSGAASQKASTPDSEKASAFEPEKVSTSSAAALPPQRRTTVRELLRLSLSSGAAIAATVSAATLLNGDAVVGGLTTDAAVRAAAKEALPLVLGCQLLKGIAYPVNGLLMGALDWSAAAAAMWAAQAACVGTVALLGRGGPLSLRRLWTALLMLFLAQVVIGGARIASGTGPWRLLYERTDDQDQADAKQL